MDSSQEERTTLAKAISDSKETIIIKEARNGWWSSKYVTIAMVVLCIGVFGIAVKIFSERDRIVNEIKLYVDNTKKELSETNKEDIKENRQLIECKADKNELKEIYFRLGEDRASISKIDNDKAQIKDVIELKAMIDNYARLIKELAEGKVDNKTMDKYDKTMQEVVKTNIETGNRFTKIEVKLETIIEEQKRLRDEVKGKKTAQMSMDKNILDIN